jgi:hypothetical protein
VPDVQNRPKGLSPEVGPFRGSRALPELRACQMSKIAHSGPNSSRTGPKLPQLPEVAQSSPKSSKTGPRSPKLAQSAPKLLVQNWPKTAHNYPKSPKLVQSRVVVISLPENCAHGEPSACRCGYIIGQLNTSSIRCCFCCYRTITGQLSTSRIKCCPCCRTIIGKLNIINHVFLLL